MIRLTQILLFGLFILSAKCKEGNKFYSIILDDFSDHSYFIPVRLSLQGNEQIYIVENSDFYMYITPKVIKIEDYKKRMLKAVDQKTIIPLPDNFIINDKFWLVGNKCLDTIVDAERIVQQYFDRREIMQQNLSEQQMACIIYKLFYEGIAVKQDDYSGSYVLYKEIKSFDMPPVGN